jgi:hypothetical protein
MLTARAIDLIHFSFSSKLLSWNFWIKDDSFFQLLNQIWLLAVKIPILFEGPRLNPSNSGLSALYLEIMIHFFLWNKYPRIAIDSKPVEGVWLLKGIGWKANCKGIEKESLLSLFSCKQIAQDPHDCPTLYSTGAQLTWQLLLWNYEWICPYSVVSCFWNLIYTIYWPPSWGPWVFILYSFTLFS